MLVTKLLATRWWWQFYDVGAFLKISVTKTLKSDLTSLRFWWRFSSFWSPIWNWKYTFKQPKFCHQHWKTVTNFISKTLIYFAVRTIWAALESNIGDRSCKWQFKYWKFLSPRPVLCQSHPFPVTKMNFPLAGYNLNSLELKFELTRTFKLDWWIFGNHLHIKIH